MFRQNKQAAAPPSERTRQLWKRVFMFGAALVLLWGALHLVPRQAPPETPDSYIDAPGDDAGVVVRSSSATSSNTATPRLFSVGNVLAFLLLAGGGGAALYLRRRSREGNHPSAALQTLSTMTLAPNQQLRLVRCGDDVLLLGVTSGQITLLKSYPSDFMEPPSAASSGEEDEAQGASGTDVAAAVTAAGTSRPSFASLLRQQAGPMLNIQQTQTPC